jgi:pyruvate dehydrogenase (quinone)
MIQSCETLLIVGSSFPYAEWLPEEGQARAVQIDIDGRLLGMRYSLTEANLVGESKLALQRLTPLLERKQDRS